LNLKTRNLFLAIAALLVFQVLPGRPAMAQEQFRAKISKIALNQNGREQEIKGKTDSVQYKRYNKPDWVSAQKKDKLYDKDRVLIKPFIYARLEMKGPQAGGDFTLWGDSTNTILPAAAYEIREDPVRLGYYQFFITYGSFVADNLRDLITAKSPAMEVKHHGTRYLMTVEKESGRTIVFVEKGEVTVYAGGDSMRLKPMEAAQALPGGALTKLGLSVQETGNYLRLIRVNHIELWSHFRPFWQKPWFYIPAAVGTGVAIWQLLKPSSDDNQAKGTITVNW